MTRRVFAAMTAQAVSPMKDMSTLMSDCNSDWQFYEHLNMKRILEDHSQDTGDGFIVYMYGGTL